MLADSKVAVGRVNEALTLLAQRKDLDSGIAVAICVLELLGVSAIQSPSDLVDGGPLKLPNAERQDPWFHPHPWMRGERAVFELLDSETPPVQAKFFWLQKKSRQHVAGAVHFTRNWEDHDFTRNDTFKIGIDFFLNPEASSVLVVVSNRGNLRVVELSDRLSATQFEIFSKWVRLREASSIAQLHEGLWESFKLQSVNENFYDGVSDSFNELLQHLVRTGRDHEDAKLFSSRLLGRLIFIWFLRKMGLIDEPADYFSSEEFDSATYYHQRLERLFFSTLNSPVGEREEFSLQSGALYLDLRTPYLNGGLFSPQEGDWFGDGGLSFPEHFFTRLFKHFEQFNFTTDESSPEYEQVAIDPEMLGRVFESLLATQVSETGAQARKARGAYYTPREIVGFMAKEALRGFLLGRLRDEPRAMAAVSKLLDTTDQDWAIAGSNSLRDIPKDLRQRLVSELDSIKAIDPACGSGAFPMGLLQLLLRCYSRLDPRFDPFKTKLQIVQNNIFGIDVEPMAVEISRLRAWLSLVVEENPSGKIEPLPNLDFKFLCANSLVPLMHQTNLLGENDDLHERLREVRNIYFASSDPAEKSKLQDKYRELSLQTDQIFGDIADARIQQLKSFNPFDDTEPAAFFDMDYMFGIDDGFDIVIGNPPYIGEKGHIKTFAPVKGSELGKRFYVGKMDYFYFFFHLGLDLLAKGGVLAYITTNYFVTATYAHKLLGDLHQRSDVLRMLNFGELVLFESAAGQRNMISILRKEKLGVDARTAVVRPEISGKADPHILSQVFDDSPDFVSAHSVPQEKLFVGGQLRLSNSTGNQLESVLEAISTSSTRLGDIFEVFNGVQTGADKVSNAHLKNYGLGEDELGKGIFVLSAEEVESLGLDDHESELIQPWFKGSDVGPFRAEQEPKQFVIYAKKKHGGLETRASLKNHLDGYRQIIDTSSTNSPYLHCPRNGDFMGPKIVMPYRTPRSRFAYVEGPWFASVDVTFLTASRGLELDLKTLTGILNSPIVFCWLYFRGKRKGAQLELYPKPLSALPLPPITDHTRPLILRIRSLVESILELDSDENPHQFEEAWSEINSLVFELYGLGEEEQRIILEWRESLPDA